MKIYGIALGAVLASAGLYVVVGEHLAGKTIDATVNARVAILRAPIEGQITLNVRNIGARVVDHTPLAEIVDDRFDNARLIDLERTRDGLKTDLQRIDSQQAAIHKTRAQFVTQAGDYQAGRVAQLKSRIAEAQAQADAAAARKKEAENALSRANDLSGKGVQTAATLDTAQSRFDVARLDLESARQRRNYLTTELESAQNGVFIGDSYNDEPFSLQRIKELDLRLAELAAEGAQIKQRLALIGEQISAEKLRLNKLTAVTLNANAAGAVWDFLVNSGDFVRRGQDLMRLVDCSTVVVTASVSEQLYNSLKVGAPARFRLFNDSRVFDATVIRLAGSGAGALYNNLAVGPSTDHLKHYDITLSVPELAADPELGCAVGRTGSAIFTTGPISTVQRLASQIGL